MNGTLRLTLAVGAAWMLAASPAAAAAAQNTAMAGEWRLNADKSDDPQQALQRGRPLGGQPGGNRGSQAERPPRGGGGGGGGGGGANMSEEQRAWMQAAMQRVSRNPQNLTISVSEAAVTMQQGPRGEMVLVTDAEVREVSAPNGAVLGISAQWKGDKLAIETRAGAAIRITEEYQVKDDGQTLEVTVSFRNTQIDQRARIKRVYGLAR